jgi:hypothetical protein
LVSDATVLDWAATASAAEALLAAPRVTPSAGGGAAAKLPERFFALQDELRHHAETVARTAKARDAEGLAEAFAAAAKTCVRCHDAYLTGH